MMATSTAAAHISWFEQDMPNLSPCYAQSISSPHMCDPAFPSVDDLKSKLNPGLKQAATAVAATTKSILDLCNGSEPDLSDPNSSELWSDLEAIIGTDNGHPGTTILDESSSLFPDILSEHSQAPKRVQFNGGGIPQQLTGHSFGRYPMPQQSTLSTDQYGAEATLASVINREPTNHIDLSRCSQLSYTNDASIYSYPQIPEKPTGASKGAAAQVLGSYLPSLGRPSLSPAVSQTHHNGALKSLPHNSKSSSSNGHHKNKENVDKSSEVYRRRREQNNIYRKRRVRTVVSVPVFKQVYTCFNPIVPGAHKVCLRSAGVQIFKTSA